VFRTTLHANEKTDVSATIDALRSKCARSNLASSVAPSLLDQVQETLSQFVSRGRQVVSSGSQMHATREIAGEGYRVRLVFRAGDRRTTFQKLIDSLRGR
jgi:hypothetical protein